MDDKLQHLHDVLQEAANTTGELKDYPYVQYNMTLMNEDLKQMLYTLNLLRHVVKIKTETD